MKLDGYHRQQQRAQRRDEEGFEERDIYEIKTTEATISLSKLMKSFLLLPALPSTQPTNARKSKAVARLTHI